MKLTKYIPELCVALAVLGAATFSFSSLFAQDGTREDVRSVFAVSQNPNTAQLFGRPGDIAIDKSSGAIYIGSGVAGTTNWRANPVLSTNSNGQTLGSMILTGTSVKVYFTSTTGVEIKATTNAPFTNS